MTEKAAPRRRSIVAFEKWLAAEIADAQAEIGSMDLEVQESIRLRKLLECKLDTLRAVADKLKEQGHEQEPEPEIEDNQAMLIGTRG